MKVALPDLRTLPARAVAFTRTPRARKWFWWTAGAVAAFGILGALLAPPIVRLQLEQALAQALHRKVTIESLRINPYALTVTVRGLRIAERGGDATAFSLEELYADLSATSLFRYAPVLAALRIVKPHVRVVRLEANRYNWSDLIDEFLNKPSDPNEPPPRFAVANIELADGAVEFDDRPEGTKHALNAIQLGVPFVSSLAVYQDIYVEPKFRASANGTPLEFFAKSKPFKESRDSVLNLNVHGLDLTRFVDYVPGKLPVKVTSARLETDLDVTFAQPRGRTPTLVVSGSVALLELDVQEPSGKPLLKVPRITAQLRAIEPLMRRFEVAKVAIEAPEMRVHRSKSGEAFLAQLFAPKPAAQKAPPQAADAAPPLTYKIDELALTAGTLDALDEGGARPVRMKFDEVRLTVQEFSSAPEAVARFDAFLHAVSNETLALAGTFGLQPQQAAGTLKLERARLPALWPYLEPFLALDAADGQLDAAAAFTYGAADGTPNVKLKDIEVALRSLLLRQRRDAQELLRIPALAVHGGVLDLRARTAGVAVLESSGGRMLVRRGKDGLLNLQQLVTAVADGSAAPASATAKPWSATLQKLAIDRYAATIEDESAGPAATALVENMALTASNLSTAKGQQSNVALKLTLNKTGTLAASGALAISPLAARLNIEAQGLGIVPAQPYFERFVNAIVSSGDITARGEVAFELPEGGAPRGSFKGDATLANFAAVTKSGSEDLLRWKSFFLGGIDATSAPQKLTIGEIALTEFFTRLVVTADGRLNLQGLIAGEDAIAAAAGGAKSGPAPADAATAKPAPPPVPATAAAPAGPTPELQIGKITLAGGNVQFSDFFIKPNYSANLTGVAGTVSAMTRDTAGDVDLKARIDNAAPVEISGKINPLAKDLTLNIKASARDIELAPLTPYATKYVGYGIEKGKLSMDVAYQLENRKLTAQNKVVLNQLTFGAKVDSPTATKLPVLFAVSLLKDRNGVIDINLPISGSIDDPQFSVGGIIVQVIVNLLVKAVTAPFALIGALFGGGEELAYVEFAPGTAMLAPAAEGKLKNLIKALTDRPALKLDVAGRIDAETDREGLKKTTLERKVKAQKLKDTVKGGVAAGAIEQVTVEPAEYAKYLSRAYGEEKFPKPRNVIGIAKDLPVPEMEQLMITHTQVTDEDLRRLAEQRAQSVKDYLVETGKIAAERLFLLAPRLSAEGVKDKGRPTRADLSLK